MGWGACFSSTLNSQKRRNDDYEMEYGSWQPIKITTRWNSGYHLYKMRWKTFCENGGIYI